MGSKTNRSSKGINPQTIPLECRENPYTSISVEEETPTESLPSSWGIIPVEVATSTQQVEVEVCNLPTSFEGVEVTSSHPTLVTSPSGEIGFNPPPAAVTPQVSKGGWVFNPNTLPLASSLYPPVGNLKGIPRDANNNQIDTAGYAAFATLRKHKGEFKTPNEWEALTKSTFSIVKVGNFSGGFRDYLLWLVFKKPTQSGCVMKEGNTFGIPA